MSIFGWKILFGVLAGIGVLSCLLCIVIGVDAKSRTSTVKRSFNFLKPITLLGIPSIAIVVMATCLNYGGTSVMTYRFTNLAKLTYKLESWQFGLAMAPYGLSTILGNLVGGKLADIAKRRNSAFLLILTLIGLVGFPSGLIAFGFVAEGSLVWSIIFMFVVGFFVCFTYPPTLCYAMEKQPKGGSSVVATFQVSYFPAVSALWSCPYALPLDNVNICSGSYTDRALWNLSSISDFRMHDSHSITALAGTLGVRILFTQEN